MSFFNLSKKIISGRKSKTASKPLYLCSPFVDNSLVTGSFKNVTQLPAHMSDFKEEWIAVNTFDFFTHLNALYGSISEFCTPSTCPVMNGLNNTEFQWIDSNKKSSRVSAPQYIDFMFTQIQNVIEDESVFPTKQGMDFPKDFDVVVKQIFKHYFRLFAHVYFAHYDKILHLEMEGHWNTLVSHVVSFAKEFDLIQDKKELSHMQELMDALRIE